MEGEDAEDVVTAGGAEGVEVLVGEAGGQEVKLKPNSIDKMLASFLL